MAKLSLESENRTVKIPIFHKASNFRLPPEISTPIILVGPGSGVAPFLGFLDHRRYQKLHHQDIGKVSSALDSEIRSASLQIYLFFGCRFSATDYVSTRHHIEDLAGQRVVTKFICAFSRDTEGIITRYIMGFLNHATLNRREI